MRLFEITRPGDILAARRRLAIAGYDLIGQGGFAMVFAKYGEPNVLKLFSNSDTGYLWFLDYVAQNPGPHWPVFKRRAISVTTDYSAIRMERLTEIPDGVAAERLRAFLDLLVDASHDGELDPNDFADRLPRSYATCTTPLFIETVGGLIRHARNDGCGIDLSPDNLMMRGDTLVVTDPIVGWGGGL